MSQSRNFNQCGGPSEAFLFVAVCCLFICCVIFMNLPWWRSSAFVSHCFIFYLSFTFYNYLWYDRCLKYIQEHSLKEVYVLSIISRSFKNVKPKIMVLTLFHHLWWGFPSWLLQQNCVKWDPPIYCCYSNIFPVSYSQTLECQSPRGNSLTYLQAQLLYISLRSRQLVDKSLFLGLCWPLLTLKLLKPITSGWNRNCVGGH